MPAVKRSTPSEHIMPNVLKVLDLVVRSIKCKKMNNKPFHDQYTQIAVETSQPKCARTIAKQCVGLANKCLCSHRYKEAAKLLWVLCQDRSVFDMFIFRASMIILENLAMENRDEIIWTFFSEIQNLRLVNKKEVQLEYIMYGLTHRCSEVKEKTQALINMKRKNYLRKNPLLDPIFEGYLAYLECNGLCEHISEGMTMGSQIDSSTNEIVLKLTSIIESPGDWDIFVIKLVELFEKHGEQKKGEMEDLLLKYVKSNPDNLNAHIYLCLYLNEIDPDSEVLIHHLKIISEMSPSDERVLILLKKWEKLDDKLESCLTLTFMFLDYPSNGKNHNAWKMLSNFLHHAKSSNDDKALETIETCWKSRYKSWHWIHFNPSQVPHLEETALVASKVKVLSFFDKDHTYMKEVFEKFPTIQESLNKAIPIIDKIDTSENMDF